MLRRGENEQLSLGGREHQGQKVALDGRLLGLRPEASLSGLLGDFLCQRFPVDQISFHIVWALELMVEVVVISTGFTFGAVRVLGEVWEILQCIQHMPHKHEHLDSLSSPYGKPGMRCAPNPSAGRGHRVHGACWSAS